MMYARPAPPLVTARRGRRTGCAAGRASRPCARLYSRVVQAKSDRGRFAERVLQGVDDAGREERIVVWIERKPGAIWAVGRMVNPQHRSSGRSRAPTTTSSRATSWTTRSSRRMRRSRTTCGARAGRLRRSKLHALHARGVLSPRALVLRPLRRSRVTASLHRGVCRPLEVRVRDRVAVRVVRREAERLVDPRLELLRDRVLEPVGLVVHVVDVDPERLREVELEQPVVADHLERDPLAGG